MRLKDGFLAVVFLILVVSVVYPQPPATHQASQSVDLSLQMWDSTAAEFGGRIGDYVRLRTELEDGLSALAVTHDPAETRRAIRALAQRIRAARRRAAQGDVFKSDVSNQFKKALLHEMDASTCATIMDENPGDLPNEINGSYPEGLPFSTVPVNILAVLPRLPEDVEYRFLGRQLILLDTRANVIIDRIPDAIQCAACDLSTCIR
jgi:hypothetical protein